MTILKFFENDENKRFTANVSFIGLAGKKLRLILSASLSADAVPVPPSPVKLHPEQMRHARLRWSLMICNYLFQASFYPPRRSKKFLAERVRTAIWSS